VLRGQAGSEQQDDHAEAEADSPPLALGELVEFHLDPAAE
jgi:hypothetical protein